MAITKTDLTTGKENVLSSNPWDTASISPADNALVICCVTQKDTSVPAAATISGGGMTTWTSFVNQGRQGTTYDHRLNVFHAQEATPGTGVIEITHDDPDILMWSVFEFSCAKDLAGNGAGAIVQVQQTTELGGGSSVTLSSLSATANRVVQCGCGNSTVAMGLDSSYTQIHSQFDGLHELETGWRDNDTPDLTVELTTTGSFSGEATCNSAFEIADAFVTYDQDGFRFYDEDNTNVNSATALAAEDTNITRAKESPFQVRLQVDTADVAATPQFKLQWRKSGGSWQDVTVA